MDGKRALTVRRPRRCRPPTDSAPFQPRCARLSRAAYVAVARARRLPRGQTALRQKGAARAREGRRRRRGQKCCSAGATHRLLTVRPGRVARHSPLSERGHGDSVLSDERRRRRWRPDSSEPRAHDHAHARQRCTK